MKHGIGVTLCAFLCSSRSAERIGRKAQPGHDGCWPPQRHRHWRRPGRTVSCCQQTLLDLVALGHRSSYLYLSTSSALAADWLTARPPYGDGQCRLASICMQQIFVTGLFEALHVTSCNFGPVPCRYAARLLLPQFPDLLLVEASAALGGRIKQVGLA